MALLNHESRLELSKNAYPNRIYIYIGKIEAGKINLQDLFSQVAIASQSLQECETYLVQQEPKMDMLIETLTDDINNGEEELEF